MSKNNPDHMPQLELEIIVEPVKTDHQKLMEAYHKLNAKLDELIKYREIKKRRAI